MDKVIKMAETPSFGKVSILDVLFHREGRGVIALPTLALTKRQAMAVGATFNVSCSSASCKSTFK